MAPTYGAPMQTPHRPMQQQQQHRSAPPAPAKMLGQGYAKSREGFKTPKKRLQLDDADTPQETEEAPKTSFVPSSVGSGQAPRKLQLQRRKLDDAE